VEGVSYVLAVLRVHHASTSREEKSGSVQVHLSTSEMKQSRSTCASFNVCHEEHVRTCTGMSLLQRECPCSQDGHVWDAGQENKDCGNKLASVGQSTERNQHEQQLHIVYITPTMTSVP
jgi:hypothetical protein